MASCAGIVLTGGASRRMGRDKATLPAGDSSSPTLAARTSQLMELVASPVIEVGPGRTHLHAVTESPPGGGPLVAMVAGWKALETGGWEGPAIVVATDLPRLTADFLLWLSVHPSLRSVVPRSGGRLQPLCARYSPGDMTRALELVEQGARAMKDLLAVIDALVVEGDWHGVLDDVDTPADLAKMNR